MDHDVSHDDGREQRLVESRFRDHVDRWDEIYDRDDVVSLIYQYRLRQTVEWIGDLGLAHDAAVLEIGCGTGRTTTAIASLGYRLHATDATPAMVDRARANVRAAGYDGVVLEAQDAHALTYGDGTFDLVVALGVLPWLHSPRRALAEIARVLRSGGHLITSADNRRRLPYLLDPRRNPALAPAREAAKRILRPSSRIRATPVRPRMQSRREFDIVIRSVGLVPERWSAFGYAPFTVMGREVFSERTSTRLHERLQSWADGPFPALGRVANQFLTLARKP